MPGFAKTGLQKKKTGIFFLAVHGPNKEGSKKGRTRRRKRECRSLAIKVDHAKKKLARLRLHRAFDAVSAAQNEEKAGELDSQHKHLCNNDVADSVTNERC